jgi:hypothetical protein
MLNKKTSSRQAGRILPKRQTLFCHTPNPNTNLRAHRDRLLSELVSLNGLPSEELARKYQRIKPQLKFVYRALSSKRLPTRNRTELT